MSTSNPWVVDVTTANFTTEVVERSKQVPVLVDFWAEWCGPCKALGPTLERLAEEFGGRFQLAKVNTDVEVELAQMFGIQSLPTVMLVADGRQVDGFAGALPEQELRRFLEQHVGASGDNPLDAVRAALDAGQVDEAMATLEGLYSDAPDDDEVKLLLAEAALAGGDRARAEGLLDCLGSAASDGAAARSLRAKLSMGNDAGRVAELRAAVEASPEDLTVRIELGRALAAEGQFEEGLEMIMGTIEVDRDHDDQAGRRAMVEVLDLLGPESDLAHAFRQRLQVAMYV